MIATTDTLSFQLPQDLACPKPTERRSLARDEVRLLVTTGSGKEEHAQFYQLPDFLKQGDVLVVNTSATQPAAFSIELPGKQEGRIHFSTSIGTNQWLAEVRVVRQNRTQRWRKGHAGMQFSLPGGGEVILLRNYYSNNDHLHLWVVEIRLPLDFPAYMAQFGRPIQYENLDKNYPLDYYQTLFSTHPGSSEMPSAGRGFTLSLVQRLQQRGVKLVPVLLHTGISSLEVNEEPYPEYLEIDPVSAAALNQAKKEGGRIIAVGTTAVRAVESAAQKNGMVQAYVGSTNLYITRDYPLKMIDALLTGFHEPEASHLHMLEAIAGREHLERSYHTALNHGYYWHQFGDLHLILP